MKIAVIAAFDSGSPFAHAINTVKMAEGFATLGHDVTMITKAGTVCDYDALKTQYGIVHDMNWLYVPQKILGFFPTGVNERYCFQVKPILKNLNPDFVYARNYSVPSYCAKIGIPCAAETHAFVGHDARAFLKMIKASAAYDDFRVISTISETLKDYYESIGAASDKIHVLPDSVDLNMFAPPEIMPPSPFSDRSKPNIIYCGHLYDYKGIPTVLEAAKLCPDYNFHFVGGLDEDIERHKKTVQDDELNNVVFHGLKTLAEVPLYLWHSDIALLPPSANHPSAKWTSPVKLGEYCASKTPIIASDIPALRRWLDDTHCRFFQADDALSLSQAIAKSLDLNHEESVKNKVENAFELAKTLTYEGRAQKILSAAGFR